MTGIRTLMCAASILICLNLWACVPGDDISAELTEEEKLMPEARYYTTDFVPVPDEVAHALAQGPVSPEKALPFENINELAQPGYLEMENGYAMLEDGSAFVAVRTFFPEATGDMIRWWFGWHALKDIRYKIWDPGAHYAIRVEDADRLIDENLSYEERFLNNPHYPVEDVGQGVMNLRIRFVAPESFGFDTRDFETAGVEAVVCGIVGYSFGQLTIEHTYMVHLFRQKDNGLELRSRFWLGGKLNMPRIKKRLISENLATDMVRHCSQEYNHLAGFLPEIYTEFDGRIQ